MTPLAYLRLLAVAGAFIAGWTVHGWHSDRAALQHQVAQAGQGLAAANEIRRFEHNDAVRSMEVAHAVSAEKVRQARITAAAVADADGLRDTLRLALAGGRSSEDRAAACERSAAVAGELLARGLRVQAALAGRAEDLAADYRGLRAAIERSD